MSAKTFAERFAELEAELNDERRDWYNNRHSQFLDDLLACVRAQQAALAHCRNESDSTEIHAMIDALDRWNLP